jgi:pyruvate ferredoxin oxidoreductase gamma subunit
MYRIRLHGRGGQGMKTASRILGSALFREGFEVQDAPRYGAERRGAPIFAYVRAARRPVQERGVIRAADLVVVADPTLVPVASAGVLEGVGAATTLLLRSDETAATWRERLVTEATLVLLPTALDGGDAPEAAHRVGVACAGAAARLLGVITPEGLEAALEEELAELPAEAVAASRDRARAAWERMAPHAGCVDEGPDRAPLVPGAPHWIEPPLDPVEIAAPDIHGTLTSTRVRTGLWRTLRPVVDRERCNRCHWICTTFCPDGALTAGSEGFPEVDYDHCKGCLVCVAVCPTHAIGAVPERDAGPGSATGTTGART